MKYYCVLWIPTAFYKDLQCKPDLTPQTTDISDITGEPHPISLKLDTKGNILIRSLKEADNRQIILTRIEWSRNGLVTYEYNIDEKEESKPLVGIEFPFAIYHCIKEFYHTHEHHEDEEDAHMKPYTSHKYPNIKSDNNPALISYLSNYESKFSAYLRQITWAYDRLSEESKDARNIFKNTEKACKILMKIGNRVKGEELYYRTLSRSKYNTTSGNRKKSIKDLFSFSPHNEAQSELSRIVFNIENTIANIKYLEEKIMNEFSLDNGITSVKIGYISFALGLLSLALGLASLYIAYNS